MEIESESENNADERGNDQPAKKHATALQVKMGGFPTITSTISVKVKKLKLKWLKEIERENR